MTTATDDLQRYFSTLYTSSDDPYEVGARWYEKRKRALLLGSLPNANYHSAYEPACGTGLLSIDLASHCGHLLASDSNPAAFAIAAKNTAHLTNITLECHALPHDWPSQLSSFDLIVLSELLYFLDAPQLARVVQLSVSSLAAGGDIVLCNWRHGFKERRSSTDAITASFLQAAALSRIVLHEESDFRLEVYSSNAKSVAKREGFL